MKIAIAALLTVVATAQQEWKIPKYMLQNGVTYVLTNQATTPVIKLQGANGENVKMNGTGDVLIEAHNSKGETTLTVYRDGHVVTADKKALDDTSILFWQRFAFFYKKEMGQCFGEEPTR